MTKRSAKKRRQIEDQEESADQLATNEERLIVNELEGVVDEEDLAAALVLSQYRSSPAHIPATIAEIDETDHETKTALKRQLKAMTRKAGKLEEEVQQLVQQLNNMRAVTMAKPPSGTVLRTDKHKRLRGKKLTDDERRAALHCLELCNLEKNQGKSVSTADPFLRTAVYFGVSQRTIRDAYLGKNLQDLRVRQPNEDEQLFNPGLPNEDEQSVNPELPNVGEQSFNSRLSNVGEQSFNSRLSNMDEQSFNTRLSNVGEQSFNPRLLNEEEQSYHPELSNEVVPSFYPEPPNEPQYYV
ncbi:hypothetical protein BGX27_002106 [Mortierella sp. AM989]|nr:hypothetical protein BGX27_002106 [Mortierella sp. AM989]